MQKLLLGVVALLLSVAAIAQGKDGYNLTFNLKNNTDSNVYLCHYYGKEQTVYKDDSAKLTQGDASFTFTSTKPLVGGIYMLLFKDQRRAEFLLNNGDKFTASFDRNDPIESMQFIGSTENTNFYEYQHFLGGISDKFESVKNELGLKKTKKDSASIIERSKEITKEMNLYRDQFCYKHRSSLASLIFNALAEPDVPEKNPKLKDGKTEDSTFRYRYWKTEYWKRFNFKDDRIVFTPLYERKLKEYFRQIPQIPDTFNYEAAKILRSVDSSKELLKYSLWWLTRYAENSKVMGMDESFVYLVENFYQKGKAYWLDDTSLQKYINRAAEVSPTILGKPCKALTLPEMNGTQHSIQEEAKKADYTILIFWSPTCGHCQKEIPSIDSLTQILIKQKKLNIQMIGVESDLEDDKWVELIKKKNLTKNWLHLHDPQRIGNLRKNFDVYSTPTIYVLDKDAIIVGKKLDHNNLESLIDFLERKKAMQKN